MQLKLNDGFARWEWSRLGTHMFGLNFQQLTLDLGIVMPESYRGEHHYRAGALTGPSGLEFFHHSLALVIYQVSNSAIDMQHNWQSWQLVTALLRRSGLLGGQQHLTALSLHCTTVLAFMEKLWQASVLYAVVSEDEEAQKILEWLLLSGHDPDSPVPCSGAGTGQTIALNAVQMSSRWGRTGVLKLLLSYGASAKSTASVAVRKPLPLVLERQLEPFPSPLWVQTGGPNLPNGPNALHVPKLHSGQITEVSQLLLAHGAVSDVSDGGSWNGEPLLSLALRLGDLPLVNTLLEQTDTSDLLFRYNPLAKDDHLIFEATALTVAAGFRDADVGDDVRNRTAMTLLCSMMSEIGAIASTRDWITADVFIAAAMADNYEVVRFLFSITSTALNSLNPFGISPLHAAARNGCVKTYNVLLDIGCQIPADKMSNVVRPLHVACVYGNAAVVELCLRGNKAEMDLRVSLDVGTTLDNTPVLHQEWLGQFHEDVSQRQGSINSDVETPLQLALACSEGGIALDLLKNGARLYGGELFIAARKVPETELLYALLDAGADPNERDIEGRSIFVTALTTIAENWAKHVKFMRLRGRNGKLSSETSLHNLDQRLCVVAQLFQSRNTRVRSTDMADILKLKSQDLSMLLLDSLQCPSAWPHSGASVLESAILSAQRDVIEKVLPEYTCTYDPASICASIAIQECDLQEVTKTLLRNRSKDGVDDDPKTLLLEATAIGLAAASFSTRPDLLLMLLRELPRHQMCILPPYPEWPRYDGQGYVCTKSPFWQNELEVTGSPLVFAIWGGNTNAFTILLDHGYKPDWRTWRALGYRNRTSLAEILRHRGFTCTIRSEPVWGSEACNTLNMAIGCRNADMVRILLDAGLPVNYDLNFWEHIRAPLQRAVEKGELNYDLRYFAHSRTPLQRAVEKGELSIIRLLLAASAKVNAPPAHERGATALQIAAIQGYLGIAKLLLEPDWYVHAPVAARKTIRSQLIRDISLPNDSHTCKTPMTIDKADVNAPRASKQGRTALEGASEHGRIDMIELLLHHGAKTTGTGRRQFVRSIKFAEREGHFVAAGLLRKCREWTAEDEILIQDPHLLAAEGWWSDEWEFDGDERPCSDQSQSELELDQHPELTFEGSRGDQQRSKAPDVAGVRQDLFSEFIQWEMDDISEIIDIPLHEGVPSVWNTVVVDSDDGGCQYSNGLETLPLPNNSKPQKFQCHRERVLVMGVDPMWGD